MIDIVKLYFYEYIRPRLRDVRIFLYGAWALGILVYLLPGEHYHDDLDPWIIGILAVGLLIDLYDFLLRRREAKARKEELYEHYRSEFATDVMRPVKSATLWDSKVDGPRRCRYGASPDMCTHGECLVKTVTEDTIDKDTP